MTAPVVLVHGVGLDGALYAPVADRLRARGVPIRIVTRRGYDDRPATADLERHLDDLRVAVAEAPGTGPVVVAGVSGGATLALALALTLPAVPRLAAVVAHEPLIGPLAPTQHDVITRSIETMLAEPTDNEIEAFLERLLTPPTWAALSPETRARAVGRHEVIRTEAHGFARFAIDDLTHRSAPVTWTVGAASPSWRHDAAAIAASADVAVTMLDCAHTPQVEDPDGFTTAILAAAP